MDRHKNPSVSVRLDAPIRELIDQLKVKERRRDTSDMIRILLEDALILRGMLPPHSDESSN